MPPSRTLILSDLHLGRPRLAAISADALRPLWRDCTRLIIHGDLAEVHSPTHWGAAARHTLRLHDLCEEDSVELTLLSGNHDPYITDVRYLELADGSIFITHGDVLHPAIAPWSPRSGILREAHDRAISAIPEAERDRLDTRLKVSQFASHQEWAEMASEAARSTVPRMLMRPWRVAQVLWYWHRFPRLAASFLAQHAVQARIGIFGHTHRAGVWAVNDRTIINTGAFGFPGRPLGVIVDDDACEVRVMRIELDRTSKAYRFAPRPMEIIALPGIVAETQPFAAVTPSTLPP